MECVRVYEDTIVDILAEHTVYNDVWVMDAYLSLYVRIERTRPSGIAVMHSTSSEGQAAEYQCGKHILSTSAGTVN